MFETVSWNDRKIHTSWFGQNPERIWTANCPTMSYEGNPMTVRIQSHIDTTCVSAAPQYGRFLHRPQRLHVHE